MKNLLLRLSALLTIALVGCQTDIPTDEIIAGDGTTTLTVTTAKTRTYLGDKDENAYPVYWSEGDKIAINGLQSEAAVINSEDASSAQFTVNATLKYPYSVTYPYTSTTSASSAKVVFPAEQSYIEGSFAPESAPMCGYATNAASKIELKHLSGILRFPIKASKEGTTLKSVVITSTSGAKLAGEFGVNCSSAALTPSNEATSVVTYTLPANFALSTSSERILYIALPAINAGVCSIEFVDGNNKKMTCSWSANTIKAGVLREFKNIVYKEGVSATLTPLESEMDELEILYPTVYGFVKDTNGNPIEGVAVSDGFSVVATDSKGFYTMDVSSDTWYIFISVPSEYKIDTNEYGQPLFYKRYPSNSPQYDFTLTPLEGGKEKKFSLVTFGDPQVSSSSKLKRFLNEAVPGIKAIVTERSKTIPCYGITLGDIISNSNSTNTGAYRDDMRDGFSVSNIGIPVFQVMGNHDNTFCNETLPLFADARNSIFELKAQREHEDMFGPVNYSFNRGDVHIIGMRDIVYTVNTSGSNYERGFLKSQWEWLQQDLALVPKDKVVVLCVHIPLYNKTENYIQNVLALLNTYKEAHVMSGHTHIIQTYQHSKVGSPHTRVYEHNVGAVCGSWWTSNLCGDGSPNGFAVFTWDGNTAKDWYYSGYNTGMNTRDYQMRLYRGNAVTGAAISGTNTNGTKGYYAFNFADNVLLANVFFADKDWTISVYEDGVYSGDMTLISYAARPYLSAMRGSGTYTDPFTPNTTTSNDMYYTGLVLGVLGRGDTATGSRMACYHMYKYTLKNKNAEIKVIARDQFGNEYIETDITEGTDYSLTKAK